MLSVLQTQCGHGLLWGSGWRRWHQKGTQQQSSLEDRSCGAQVSLHWASSPLPLPHGGELHKAISLQGCLWAEIISPLNRKEAYKVGVHGKGSQNVINRYSPLSNYTAALPGTCTNVCRHIYCLLAGAGGRRSCLPPRRHRQAGAGQSGTSFFILDGLGEDKTQGRYKRFLSCRPCSHQRSRHGGTVVLFCLQRAQIHPHPTNYVSLSGLPRRRIKDYTLWGLPQMLSAMNIPGGIHHPTLPASAGDSGLLA